MTLPAELIELLAFYPPSHVILDAKARVLSYSNENSQSIEAPPEPGMTRVTNDINFYGPDTETNMRSALSACKALIEAGFDVDVHASKMMMHDGRWRIITEWGGTWVTVDVGHEIVTPAEDVPVDRRSEIQALVKPWGGDLGDNYDLAKGPPAPTTGPSAPNLGSATSVRRRRGADF